MKTEPVMVVDRRRPAATAAASDLASVGEPPGVSARLWTRIARGSCSSSATKAATSKYSPTTLIVTGMVAS